MEWFERVGKCGILSIIDENKDTQAMQAEATHRAQRS